MHFIAVTIDAHNDGLTHALVVYAKYWIVNHTGLNLVYAQEADQLAAGQGTEALKPKPTKA
jgi:SHR-binding domain of vacuolar-sorting associated protein 13